MNVLFPTISRFAFSNAEGMYGDLVRRFRKEGHSVVIAAPNERRYPRAVGLFQEDGVEVLGIRTLNILQTNRFEKGIAMLLIDLQFQKAIDRHLGNRRFDLILYATPPITLTRAIAAIKHRYHARTYLLLKDIFPQNAVDLGMMSEGGLWHRYFRKREKELYALSDHIGCMSPANVEYVRKHNPELAPDMIEENPNCIELKPLVRSQGVRDELRKKHHLPQQKTIFVYGGNLGKPQGVDFLFETIEACRTNQDACFLVIGNGTEYRRVRRWFEEIQPPNAILSPSLPKAEYERLLQACDVGLIFLDRRFTIPNYPSRLLSYLENSMPVIAATDPCSDVGTIAEQQGYGFRVLSGDRDTMSEHVRRFSSNRQLIEQMGARGRAFLEEHYTIDRCYQTIMSHFTAKPGQPEACLG